MDALAASAVARGAVFALTGRVRFCQEAGFLTGAGPTGAVCSVRSRRLWFCHAAS
ncbi:hypothetical protein GCM10027452_33070 [Micromonospora halotolerans]